MGRKRRNVYSKQTQEEEEEEEEEEESLFKGGSADEGAPSSRVSLRCQGWTLVFGS